jgi:transposase
LRIAVASTPGAVVVCPPWASLVRPCAAQPLLGVFHLVVTGVAGLVSTVHGMSYSIDLTDEQWALSGLVSNSPGKRGPKHAPDLRRVVDAMLYVSHTGCQRRYLPESFGPWTRVWSQFRRWSRNGTWTRALRCCTWPPARRVAGPMRRRRWWSSTPTSSVGRPTTGSPSTTAVARSARTKGAKRVLPLAA